MKKSKQFVRVEARQAMIDGVMAGVRENTAQLLKVMLICILSPALAWCSATIWMRTRIASSVDVPRRGCHCLTRMFPVVSSECSQMSSSSIHWERQSLR